MVLGGLLTPGQVPSSSHHPDQGKASQTGKGIPNWESIPNWERLSKLGKARCRQLAEEREMVWAKHPRSTR